MTDADRLARKAAARRRQQSVLPIEVRALCPGCGAQDERGQPTACQQGCPVSYVPRGTSAAGPPVGERQGRHPAGRTLKKKVPRGTLRRPVNDPSTTRDEISQDEPDAPEPVVAPPKRRKALPERQSYPGGDKGTDWCMGWWVCCARPFYVGYGWTKAPPCTSCGTSENVRKATVEEVHG